MNSSPSFFVIIGKIELLLLWLIRDRLMKGERQMVSPLASRPVNLSTGELVDRQTGGLEDR